MFRSFFIIRFDKLDIIVQFIYIWIKIIKKDNQYYFLNVYPYLYLSHNIINMNKYQLAI